MVKLARPLSFHPPLTLTVKRVYTIPDPGSDPMGANMWVSPARSRHGGTGVGGRREREEGKGMGRKNEEETV